MSKKIKTTYAIFFSLIVLTLIGVVAYKKFYTGTAPARDISKLQEKYYYLNLDKDVKYVGDDNCKSCHSEIHENFHTTGMGRSLYKPSASNEIEDFDKDNIVYDKKSDYYYKLIKKGGDYYQVEFRKDKDGNITHELEKKIEYVIGSGNKTRSYLYSENGFFYEMPVSWYSEKAKWDMSPGYENFNLRFSRPIIEECMNCHNSYTGFQEFSENRYDPHLQEGIGCERCHGPGELHVLRQTDESGMFESLDKIEQDTIDRTIVNQVNLTLEENLSVCFQCHLQGDVRVFTDGRKQSDFRPGMKLEDVKTVFVQDDIKKGDFKVASHAARMILSDCFIKSDGGMTCITCHDPHVPVKSVSKDFFNGKCLGCHDTEKLNLSKLKEEHSKTGNCVSCHMKQGGTKDVMHVNFTDHWIRIESGMNESADNESGNKRIKLKDIVNEGDELAKMNLGIAYVTYFETKDQDPEYLRNAIPLLEEDLKKYPDHKNGLYNLGLAYFRTGRTDEAISTFQKLVSIDPGNAQAFYMLGTVYEKAKIFPKAMESYQASLTIFPDNIKVLNSLGNLFYNNGKIGDALAAYTLALNLNSGNVNVLNNLGDINLYKLKNTNAARDLLVKAVELDPEFLPALNNLGNYYFITNDTEKAEDIFNEILRKDPANLLAMGNLAVIYEGRNEKEKAKKMLEKVLKINPGDPRALQMLDNLKQQQ